MRLPFEIPSKLHAFSAEFMSAFDSEADQSLPVLSRVDSMAGASAEVAAPQAPSLEVQARSIASAASEAASLISSSFRALVPSSNHNDQLRATALAPSPSNYVSHDVADDLPASCRDVQDSVDSELAAFRRLSASAPLSLVVTDLLRHNYMRLSFAMLLLGLLLLYFL
jgi:hypothetical protein